MRKRQMVAALAAAGALLGIGSAAQAGEWRLDPWRCPDLREDILDARVDYGRADRREDRIDRRYTNCPRSAWVYVGDRYDRYGRYYSDYRAGPPRYRDYAYRNGYLIGSIGDSYFRIVLADNDRFQRYYRYSPHYYRRDVRYDHRNDHRDQRYARREDHRDDRYDRRNDRRDDRGDRRNDRRDDHSDRRNDRRDDRGDRRDDRRDDRGDRRDDRRDDRRQGRGNESGKAPSAVKGRAG